MNERVLLENLTEYNKLNADNNELSSKCDVLETKLSQASQKLAFVEEKHAKELAESNSILEEKTRALMQLQAQNNLSLNNTKTQNKCSDQIDVKSDLDNVKLENKKLKVLLKEADSKLHSQQISINEMNFKEKKVEAQLVSLSQHMEKQEELLLQYQTAISKTDEIADGQINLNTAEKEINKQKYLTALKERNTLLIRINCHLDKRLGLEAENVKKMNNI
jgi:hypothetical protein